MACANGQIQIGIHPDTLQPICSEAATTPSTGGNPWWNQAINVLPGVLGGVAAIVGSSKGNEPADNITIVQNPVDTQKEKKAFPWLWVIVAIVIVILLFVFVMARKKGA